jgi:uncharacterized membrane protein YfcA
MSKKKNINWTITGWFSLGSVPAALVTLWILTNKTDITALNAVIKYSLGWALLMTSIAVLFKRKTSLKSIQEINSIVRVKRKTY